MRSHHHTHHGAHANGRPLCSAPSSSVRSACRPWSCSSAAIALVRAPLPCARRDISDSTDGSSQGGVYIVRAVRRPCAPLLVSVRDLQAHMSARMLTAVEQRPTQPQGSTRLQEKADLHLVVECPAAAEAHLVPWYIEPGCGLTCALSHCCYKHWTCFGWVCTCRFGICSL